MKTTTKPSRKNKEYALCCDFKTRLDIELLGFVHEGDGIFTRSFLGGDYTLFVSGKQGSTAQAISLTYFGKQEDWPNFTIMFSDTSEFTSFAKTLLPWCQGDLLAKQARRILQRLLGQAKPRNNNKETKKGD